MDGSDWMIGVFAVDPNHGCGGGGGNGGSSGVWRDRRRSDQNIQVPTTEQPEAKRTKLGEPQPEKLAGDTPMGLQSDSNEGDHPTGTDYHKGLSYCLICCKMVDHIILECPDLSKGSGIYCFVCEGPCKSSDDEHHRKNHFETIMFCDICGEQATHWSDNCSYGTDYRTARCEDAYGDSDIGCV